MRHCLLFIGIITMVILFAENGPNALYSLYLNHCDDVIGCSVHPKYDLAIDVPYMLHVHSLGVAGYRFLFLFVCSLGGYHPSRKFFTHMKTSPLLLKGCKF